MRRKSKVFLGGLMVVTLSLSMMVPVAAMPADVNGGDIYDVDDLPGTSDDSGDLPDDSDLISPIDADYVAVGAANVRDWPNGNVIGTLTAGETYYVVGKRTDCNWYQITGYATNAYVYADYLIPEMEYLGNRAGGASDDDGDGELDFTPIDLMMQATAHVNMRSTPNGDIVGVLEQGQDIHVVGNVDNVCWYKCEYNGETVYIYDDYLVPDFPQTMAATHNVNIRLNPNVNAPIIGSLSVGEKVKVSDMENGWYKFTFNDEGDVGYSYGDYLAAVE